LLPTIDFGHLHARGLGAINSLRDYREILDRIGEVLGADKLKVFHCHFSRIEYTQAGERRHRTYDETDFGPDFLPLAEILAADKLEPRIICESKGTMADDALTLKTIYVKVLKHEQNGRIPKAD